MSYKDYEIFKSIGKGGNGKVFLVKDSTGKEFALKRLKIKVSKNEFERTRIERFKTEAIKTNQLYNEGQEGIIPVLNYELPCTETGYYYFTMPEAIPLEKKITGSEDIYELVDIFKDLASTLKELHYKNITHRDIKPENILYYNGSYCFGDFGLIDFPEKEDLTRVKESLGNRKTMAPEMRTPINVEDSRPADVYSFAKTLWIVLTKEEFAFDGQYNYFENGKLQQKYPKQHLVELNKLLRDATAESPSKRPTINQFLDRLSEWEKIAKDGLHASKSLWEFIEESVTQQFQPSTVMWTKEDQVIAILQKLTAFNFNHTFIHDSGGMDLKKIFKVDWVKEKNVLGIDFDYGLIHLFKLKRLVWEIPNNDARFSYFRLEFGKLNPIFNKEENIEKEYLFINNEGEYEKYDDKSYKEICRWTDGIFLIVPKPSIYNSISATYDGRHGKLSTEEFSMYMEMLSVIYDHHILKEHFSEIANLDPSENNNFDFMKNLIETDGELLKKYIKPRI
ncbi:hypothetical protein B1B04_05365 [Lysinibacillus sp. KCTC 33748]|uniref:protein kinase domain-containing protein n=1 Tax=unclassified Lysinibacillus TaxID=2636778 RepID=UPI0009A82B54|nr:MULTISPECIES: protein kinase [unclassified Lysinibacillus]OXS76403.1 hypothetical protein B1B04_05365 [Lysinibacillus sp. KCTC 33748]SKB45412.1 serine/threonine protein kinase [Lysinibacillus sp. AC-3]